MGDTIAQTRFENVSKHSNDSLLARGNTLQSDEDRLKLDELMTLCTILQSRVLDLEKTKTTQANEIASLKRRVKKLEKKISSRTHKLKRLYKVGLSARYISTRDERKFSEDTKQGKINVIDADKDITLVNVQDNADKLMYDVGTMTGDEVFVEQEVAAKDVNLTVDEVTLAQALAALKSVKPKVKGDVIEEPNVSVNAASASTKVSAATTTSTTILTPRKRIVITELGTPTITRSSQQPSQAKIQDKGKEKMIKPKPMKKISKKDQLMSDEEEAKRLQAEFDEEERLAREKDEANVALTEEWDDIQAKIKADHELAQRLQAEEQEELSVEEKAKLFQQLLEQRRKHFAAKSAEEKRNKPPTQAQQRKIMCTYLKNMEGKKLKDLKNKSFDSIQKMFDRAFKRVNTFVDHQKRLCRSLMEVIPNEEEVAIDDVPLATKPPTIVDCKLKEFDLLKWDQHICFLANMNVLLLHLIERKDENKRLDHLKQESYFSAGNGAVFIDRKNSATRNWSIRRIGTQYGVSGLLGVGSKNKIFQNFLEMIWIRRIKPSGYGISDLLDTAYQTYSVQRIELLRYGVLGSLGTEYWVLSGNGVFYILGTRIELHWVQSLAESVLS
ncbi:hypothetical protein Tco_1094020 [Tanacetum coccineum]|uniref:Uncharacterized protein n=1 Tax=Tanacetum coccineum TaxID=301880 RepID=A0ABQ5IGH6_9ASTR